MRTLGQIISAILITLAAVISFYALLPGKVSGLEAPLTSFSTARAFKHVKEISKTPHFVGSTGHEEVKKYIIGQLTAMGLHPMEQTGYTAGDWANLSKATNIIARIEGSGGGKALVLLSHYDSHPHSSKGASDAGSGVATVLEGVRAFLAQHKKPVNDIIVLFSDSEELGLNGAQLFVKKHPWLKNAGVVLNFEARGSGGPSYMLIETNGGNAGMVNEFKKAGPDYPVANSFMYSIYKLLPNDTDLTVFREGANVNGFNFAFIDDHFDYHTQLDTYERLDAKTLEHQGSYLMPLLDYLGSSDLSGLQDENDLVYFNMPLFKLVSYPFYWIVPMLVGAIVLFVVLLLYGKRKKLIRTKEIVTGFLPFLFILVVNGVLGYFAWPLITRAYPAYQDILHGFTYNGHWYIAAFAAISLGFCFMFYTFFKKIRTAELSVAPLFFWLLITTLLSFYLKGGAFFVIPFYFSIMMWFLILKNRKVSLIWLGLLAIPTVVILVPFVQMFPVGLGLKMMIASTLFVSLIFGLLVPLFGKYEYKRGLSALAFLAGIVFLAIAHVKSGFTAERPKPSSLVYYTDADTGKSYWATYDHVLTPWVKKIIKDEQPAEKVIQSTFSSKYHTPFAWVSLAKESLGLAEPIVQLISDTVYGGKRHLNIAILPKRPVNRLEVFSLETKLESVLVNGVALDKTFLNERTANSKIITHYVSDNDPTIMDLVLDENTTFKMTLVESANNLMLYGDAVTPRPSEEIPMPFVLNDATIIKKTYTF